MRRNVEWPAKFLEGVSLFNSGHFFETHELWEDVWRATPQPEHDFYQGMIHLTVALYQAGRGNWKGAHAQLRRAGRRLAAFEPAYRGLPVRVLRDQVSDAVLRIQAGSTVRYPAIQTRTGTG